MKIRSTIEFRDENAPYIAERIAKSLAPDNLSSMETETSESSAKIHIKTEKITSLIATMDDLLMNAKVAEEVLENLKE
ncbi:KEOPS complex subunit Pcc1 [Methanolobus sp. ZRKC3]|uniref:KEOPS complex subunit Pcc1 n=1 Tax=Methanolobus sp. ZRKC3 TaxID=3125786 RepID=UPI00325356DA